MMDQLSDQDRWLAAEYALGVLDHDTMRLAEQQFETSPQFRQAVEEWQSQLSPMLDDIEPVEPDAAVWQMIEQRIGTPPEIAITSWWDNLSVWRWTSTLTGGLAVASLAALLFLPTRGMLVPAETGQPLIATLTATGHAPGFIARFEPETGALFIRTSAGDQAEARVPELWIIPDDGVPRSLGILDDDGLGILSVNTEYQALFDADVTLAVSLEPAGGSPTGSPTGPVIASGKMQML